MVKTIYLNPGDLIQWDLLILQITMCLQGYITQPKKNVWKITKNGPFGQRMNTFLVFWFLWKLWHIGIIFWFLLLLIYIYFLSCLYVVKEPLLCFHFMESRVFKFKGFWFFFKQKFRTGFLFGCIMSTLFFVTNIWLKKAPNFFPSLNSKVIMAYFTVFTYEFWGPATSGGDKKKRKIKVVPLILMNFWSRNNLDQLDRLTP